MEKTRSSNTGIAYLDSSAIIKLVIKEPESKPLIEELAQWPRRVSSELAVVEVIRAADRFELDVKNLAVNILRGVALIDISHTIIFKAASIAPGALRSLDAIHLATALQVSSEIDAFISYDRKLGQAAISYGLTSLSPS